MISLCLFCSFHSGDIKMMPFFEQRRKRRKAVRRIDLRWPNGDVPYYLTPGHFSKSAYCTLCRLCGIYFRASPQVELLSATHECKYLGKTDFSGIH